MRKRKNKYLVLLILLLVVTVGYAALQTTLKINGSAIVKKQGWSVYWANIANQSGVTPTSGPTIGADQGDPANTKVTWAVTLNEPGDFFEFTVDAVNAGSIDAMIAENGISDVVSPALPTNPDYIKYSVTYSDGTALAPYHKLAKVTVSGNETTPTIETYKVRVYYDENAATATTVNGMESDTTYTFTFGVTYVQADDNAIDLHPEPINPFLTRFDGNYIAYYWIDDTEGYEESDNANYSGWYTSLNPEKRLYLRTDGTSPEICNVFGSGTAGTVCLTSTYYNSNYSDSYESDFENLEEDISVTTISELTTTGLTGYSLTKAKEMLSKGATSCDISYYNLECDMPSGVSCSIHSDGNAYCSNGDYSCSAYYDAGYYCD